MGTISFLLPEDLPADQADQLSCACMAGGPDSMPWPGDTYLDDSRLTIDRNVDESGYLLAPWKLPELGSLMGSSSTLMERDTPYELLVELARGKVNQVRCQMQDWCMGGLQTSPELENAVRQASLAFGRSVLVEPAADRYRQVRTALSLAYHASDLLVRAYIDQVLHIRHQHQAKLDTLLSCRLRSPLARNDHTDLLKQTCNGVGLELPWCLLEPSPGNYQWEPCDRLVEYVCGLGMEVSAGPLIDFSALSLPDWVFDHDNQPQELAHRMTRCVEMALKRYQHRIRRWQLASGSNWSNALHLSEEDMLWLTVRLIETARQVDPRLELSIGLVQPWGEYMATQDRLHSPFVFIDTLLRAGANLSALNLELVMGVANRGNYCRDLLETSRLIDLYALLGTPLHITLGYPSVDAADPQADPALRVGQGQWRSDFSDATQADWAATFAALAVSKPCVHAVHWVHFSDQEPHQFPNCGLVDRQGQAKAVAAQLRRLREQHLR